MKDSEMAELLEAATKLTTLFENIANLQRECGFWKAKFEDAEATLKARDAEIEKLRAEINALQIALNNTGGV